MSNHVSGLSFLERLLPRSAQASRQDDGRPSQPVVMGLEERMALRRDMMCEVVVASLEEGGMPAGAFRFRVVAADRRAHSYAVMVDLPLEFMDSAQGSQRSLALRAHAMVAAARARFRLHVVGVYWRVLEHAQASGHPVARSHPERPRPFDSLPASTLFEPVASNEIHELEQALRAAAPTSVGARVYHSDVAPLN